MQVTLFAAPVANPSAFPPGLVAAGGGSAFGSSRRSKWRRCKRFYAFWRNGWAEDNSEARMLGTLLHQGLAHYYSRRAIREAGQVQAGGVLHTSVDGLLPPVEAIRVLGEHLRVRRQYIDTASAALEGFIQLRIPLDDFIPLAIEQPVSVDLGGGKLATAILDLVIRRATGDFIIDYKGAHTATEYAAGPYDLREQLYVGDAWGKLNLPRYQGTEAWLIHREPPYKVYAHPIEFERENRAGLVGWLRDDEEAMLRDEARYGTDPFNWPPRLSGGEGEGCENKFGRCPRLDVCRKGRHSTAAAVQSPRRET